MSVVSPDTPVFSFNKTDRHDITEILLKVVLNTINQTFDPTRWYCQYQGTGCGTKNYSISVTAKHIKMLLIKTIVSFEYIYRHYH